MITFDKAKQFAHDELLGSDLTLDENVIIEKSFGWFFGVSENYGCSGIIVDRDNGHVFPLGSGHTLEEYFDAYVAGFKYDFYDLTILSIQDISKTARLLFRLFMRCVIPEDENRAISQISQAYSVEQIQLALKSLPCTFSNQKFNLHFETFQEIDKADCCKYQLIGHYQDNT